MRGSARIPRHACEGRAPRPLPISGAANDGGHARALAMYIHLKKANESAHRCKSVDCTCAAEVGPDSHAVRACARTYWGPSAF